MLSNGRPKGEGGIERVGGDGDAVGGQDQPSGVDNGNPLDHRELAGLKLKC